MTPLTDCPVEVDGETLTFDFSGGGAGANEAGKKSIKVGKLQRNRSFPTFSFFYRGGAKSTM